MEQSSEKRITIPPRENVLDLPGWIGGFTEDGVGLTTSAAKRHIEGEHLKEVP